jgi:hypothetical protein
LFLKSDVPYAWPCESRLRVLLGLVVNVATLGAFARMKRREFERAGHIEVWPFLTAAEYRRALSSPPYLRGVGS